MNLSPITLAVTLGDPTGIGPEVALKSLGVLLAEDDDTCFVLLGDRPLIARLGGVPGWDRELPPHVPGCRSTARVSIAAVTQDLPEVLSPGHPRAAEAAMAWLRRAGEGCLCGEFNGMVTGPVNKGAILNTGQPFVGQTEYLADLAGVRRFTMMLLGHDDRGRWLRVALATTHLPLRDVAKALNSEQVRWAIELAGEACQLLGMSRRRVGVCGLNPHAGEGGHLGREELDLIGPTVAGARASGLDVHGPFPADTLFHQAFHGAYDAVVAMYHDQGLPPLKMVAFDTGVNWTLGLPFVRTSPDHGTAYDLVGRNLANPGSMIAALRLARQIGRANT